MYKPILTVMVGLSGSGKSTIAKTELADENTVIVSSDAIREELCGAVEDQSKNVEVLSYSMKEFAVIWRRKRM